MKKNSQYTTLSKIMTVLFSVLCLFWIMPVVEVLINSFKSNNAVNLNPFALPNSETFTGHPIIKLIAYYYYLNRLLFILKISQMNSERLHHIRSLLPVPTGLKEESSVIIRLQKYVFLLRPPSNF